MSGALDVVQGVLTVAKAIYEEVERAKANQAQCGTLAGRVRIVETALVDLNAVQRGGLFKPALQDLKVVLDEILVWVRQYGEQGWFKRVWKAQEQQAQFIKFSERLQQSMQQLELGVGAQALINHEQDVKDQKADHAYLQTQLKAIEANQEQELKALQHLDEKQTEHQVILQQQMAAYHRELLVALALLQPLTPSKAPVAAPSDKNLPKHLAIPYFELQFDFSQPLGKSALGESYRGEWQSQPVAIKQLAGTLTTQEQKLFGREITVLSRLQNEHVIQFYGACMEERRACIVTEYLSGGSLAARLARGALDPVQQKTLLLDIARGLHYLHVKGLVHANLSTASVFLTASGRAKLSEFGLAQSQSASLASFQVTPSALAQCAPELLQLNPAYSSASDVYSYGSLLYALISLRPGRESSAPLDKAACLVDLPAFYADILRACWETVPSQRPLLPALIQQLEAYQPVSADGLRAQGVEAERIGDLGKARDYYTQALAAGSASAAASLGMFAWKGQGGEAKNPQRAYDLFKRGAEAGHSRAMYNLAYLLETGDGVTADRPVALQWYQRLAEGLQHSTDLRQKARERIEKIRQRYSLVLASAPQEAPTLAIGPGASS